MNKTFDFYRSTDCRYHTSLDQEDNYQRYLKRIQNIVSKKPLLDLSTTHYMGILNRLHEISRNHHNRLLKQHLNIQNQFLLEKIIAAKKRKMWKGQQKYKLAMQQKRIRQQQRINKENKKIAQRVTKQSSTINLRKIDLVHKKQSSHKINEKACKESKVKEIKLPNLLELRS